MISLENRLILTPLQKLPKNVGDWANKLLPNALKTCPKFNKSPNLVTLNADEWRLSHQSYVAIIAFYSPEFLLSTTLQTYVNVVEEIPQDREKLCKAQWKQYL